MRGTRHRGKCQRGPVKGNMTRWIAGVERYLAWGLRQGSCDQAAVDPHALSCFIDRCPGRAKARACVRGQNLEALVLENTERGIMQCLNTVVGEHAPRLKRILQGSVMTAATAAVCCRSR